jgi:hypothetical protein
MQKSGQFVLFAYQKEPQEDFIKRWLQAVAPDAACPRGGCTGVRHPRA